MCLGVMPGEAVGRLYGFYDFVQLGRAVVNGDLRTYEEVLISNNAFSSLLFFIRFILMQQSDHVSKPTFIHLQWHLPCTRAGESDPVPQPSQEAFRDIRQYQNQTILDGKVGQLIALYFFADVLVLRYLDGSAVRWMGNEEMDLDEIECVVANLIYQGKVKGYISHQKRILIVSKQDPFPRSAVVKTSSSSSR